MRPALNFAQAKMARVRHTYSIPLRARFRGLDVRDGMILHGPSGLGEFSPFWDYDDEESAPWLQAAYEAAHHGWPTPVRQTVPVNVTIPAVSPVRARELVVASGGCGTAKVKVAEPGESLDDELNRVAAVKEAMGESGKIRVDANGGWDVDTAVRHLKALDRAAGGLEYAEQPCPTVPELAQVRRRTQVPVAADESIRRASDPLEVARQEAADLVVVKVQPLGGVRAALRIIEEVALPAVVSSALESSVGIAAGVALAAALPELPFACGLATVNLFTRDTTATSLVPVRGSLPVVSAQDLKLLPISADDSMASAFPQASEPTANRWQERYQRILPLAQIEQVD